jgi:polysaccharide biosynthesis transport protein
MMDTANHDSYSLRRGTEGNAEIAVTSPWPDLKKDQLAMEALFGRQEERKTLRDYLSAILARKWVVAIVFAVFFSASVYYAYTATPYYVSRATIEMDKGIAESTNLGDLMQLYGKFDLAYQTQIEFLKSKYLVEEFLRRLKKRQAGANAGKSSKAPDPIAATSGDEAKPEAKKRESKEATQKDLEAERRWQAEVNSLRSKIQVIPVPGTQLIDVAYGSSDPLVARNNLQLLLDVFIELNRDKKSEIAKNVKSWLQKELGESKRLLDASNKDLLEFTKEHGIVPSTYPSEVASSFGRASDRYLKSATERINLEAMAHGREDALTPEGTKEYLQVLKRQLTQLQAQYTEAKLVYSPNFVKVTLLRNKIEAVTKSIAELEKKQLASKLVEAKEKEKETLSAYEKSKEQAIGKSSLSVQYEILKKAMEANAQVYLMLLKKSKQAEMDQGVMGQNIIISSEPSIPVAPVSPKKNKIIAAGAILGLMCGLGLALVLQIFDDTVQSTKDIQDRLKIPILGVVPKLKGSGRHMNVDADGTPYEFLAHRYPSSPFADAVRIIQDTASSLLPDPSDAMICVSSALPMEGKTLLCVVMGTVIASEGKRVLIIDGDLRKPRIHKVFGSDEIAPGLSDLVTGRSDELKPAIRGSNVEGLYYMTAGPVPDNPTVLLKSERMQEVIEECRKIFDVVIVDSSPLLGVVDARILSGYSDGLILVSRAGHTPLEILKQAKEAIRERNGRLLGIVLNMADQKSDGYSRYYRKYYYSKSDAKQAV